MQKKVLLSKIYMIFALFIIIPLIIAAGIFYYISTKQTENEISNINSEKLKITKNISQTIEKKLRDEVINISMNEVFNYTKAITNYEALLNDKEKIYRMSSLLNMFYDVVQRNEIIQSAYIYRYDTDYVITTNNNLVTKKDFKDSKIIDIHKELSNTELSVISIQLRKLDNYNVLTYIYPLKSYLTSIQGLLVINIYENKFCELFNDTSSETDGHIMIVNGKGEIISSIDKSLLGLNAEKLPYLRKTIASAEDEGYFIEDMESGKHLISYFKSKTDNWMYLGIYNLNKLNERTKRLSLTIILAVLIITFLGAYISYFVSRKLYSPIRGLIEHIKKQKGFDMLKDNNEMNVIKKAFDMLVKNEKEMTRVIESNEKITSDYYLQSLLNNNYIKDAIPENRDLINDEAQYICAVVIIDGYKEFCSDISHEQQYYIKTLIQNVSQTVIVPIYKCKTILLGNGKILVIIEAGREDKLDGIENIPQLFKSIQNELKKVLLYTVSVGIGLKHTGIEGVKLSYIEANQALRRKLNLGNGSIIQYSSTSEKHEYFYPYYEENAIFNSLQKDSDDETDKAVIMFFKKIRENEHISVDNTIQIINQLLGDTIKFIVSCNKNPDNLFNSDTDLSIYSQINGLETIDEVEEFFKQLYGKLRKSLYVGDKSIINQIIEYIHENLKSGIDINEIAEHTGLSYSHVRKVFKAETGKSILEYMNNLRIEEAKKYLDSTDEKISYIAVKLGYNDDQSFTRFFKKYEGITPGEYRKRAKTNL